MQRYIDELSVLHALRLAVVATDDAGQIVFANDAAAQVYAVERDALLGRPVREILSGGPDEASPFDLARVLAGETWRGDLTVR